MLEYLKAAVCDANIELQRRRLVIYSWGNVSGIDRKSGLVAIKPSGISYDELTPEKIVLVDLQGNVMEGGLSPSSDTQTHLELYRNFSEIGGVCHTHSTNATAWAQACKPMPCLGTTHADYFYGAIPVTETMSSESVGDDYELNTGKSIVTAFRAADYRLIPAVLVANHGPFTWGDTPARAVEIAAVLEQVSELALKSAIINPKLEPVSPCLLDRHFLRKHGECAYYGQK